MDIYSEEQDNVVYESTSNFEVEGNLPADITLEGIKKMDPEMMKALKLFAKNHQQLEKASDPHKGQHRKVFSQDGRTLNNFIACSIYERNGAEAPLGPRYVNEMVEKELEMYKKEVEDKFKQSYMNNSYRFPRKAQQTICRTGPDRSLERDGLTTNNMKKDMKNFFTHTRLVAGAGTRQNKREEEVDKRAQTYEKYKFNDYKSQLNQVQKQQAKSFFQSPKLDSQQSQNSTFMNPKTMNTQANKPTNSTLQDNSIPNGFTQTFNQTFSKPNTNETSPITTVDQSSTGQIVINKPIVIQFQNKKITFVNDPSKVQKQRPKVASMYRSSAQPSPRTMTNQTFNSNQFEESFIVPNNQVLFTNNVMNNKRQKLPISQNKNQVNHILNQILQFDNAQSPHNTDASNQARPIHHPKVAKFNDNSKINAIFGKGIISRTHDQRKPKLIDNYLDYSKNSSNENMPYLTNSSFASHQQKPKVSNGAKFVLNQIVSQQQQSRIHGENSRKTTPNNIQKMKDQINRNIAVSQKESRSQSKPLQLKPNQKIIPTVQSLRNSFLGNHQNDYQSQTRIESGINNITARNNQRKIRTKQVSNINSPSRELQSLLQKYDIQDDKYPKQRLILTKLRQKGDTGRNNSQKPRKLSTSRV